MPEGDTIHRAARTLQRALADQVIEKASSPLPEIDAQSLVGHRLTRVEALGKNLLMHFDDGRVLRSHMRMSGSWHIYRSDEPWQRPQRQARIVLATSKYQAVLFNAPVLELLTAYKLERQPMITNLGPDIIGDVFDINEALTHMRADAARPLGDAVLDQRLVAGIGNVYKSEVLFLEHLDPFAGVGAFTDDELLKMLKTARDVMFRNLEHHKMRTTRRALGGPRLWVYRRANEPCLRCETRIAMRRQGRLARSTYYCALCQPSRH